MVEEASAAAASMNDQAARLSQLTAFFKLRDGYTGVPGSAEFIAVPSAPSAPATPSAAAAGARKYEPTSRSTERRGGSRPCSKAARAPPVAAPQAAVYKAAAGAASDNDWSEF